MAVYYRSDGNGAGASEFSYPTAVAFSHGSGKLYILDQGNNRVQVFE